MLLPATPGWVSLQVVVRGPRHSWLRVPGAVPRHSWLGSAGGGGVWCVVCSGGVLVGLWLVCGVVGYSPLLAEVPVCYYPPLLAAFRCRWWWAFLATPGCGSRVRFPATPGWGPPAVVVCGSPPLLAGARRLWRCVSRVGFSLVVCVCPWVPFSLVFVYVLLCLAVFVASARCSVPCVVLCCVSRVAVPRWAAARCVARCCAVVCCVIWLRSVGAAARCAVPSGAPRRPGALCFAALCFAVFPHAVCAWSLRGGVCCCSPLCSVLCVSLGAVRCVPCPLRSVRCRPLLCWCACVVLFEWCLLLLAPGAVVCCRVLCCLLWCAVVQCWIWWPVVFCSCRAVAPCCPFCFAGGVGLCLFPVLRCASCCSVPVASVLLLVLRAVECPCVLWCLPGRSAVRWCRSGVSWCLAVLCVVLWCPARCAVSCGAVLPCGVVLVGCAVRLSALLVFVFPLVLYSFANYPCCFSVPSKSF